MTVDVVIPVYNSNIQQLDQCVQSCLEQEYKDIKINIVIDGCKRDYSYILNKYDVKVFHLNKNLGPGGARNFAMQNSTSGFISFIDADDFVSKDKISASIKELNSDPRIDLVCGNYRRLIDNHDNGLFYKSPVIINHKMLLKVNYIALGSVTITRNAFEKVMKYRGYFFDERFNIAEDYSAWLALSEIGELTGQVNMKYIHNDMYTYRVNTDSNSLYLKNKHKEKEIISIIKNESNGRINEARKKKESAIHF